MDRLLCYVVKNSCKCRIMQLALSCLVVLSSCEKATTWNLKESEMQVVVDALITNEFKQHLIYIYNSVQENNSQAIPVSGVEIRLLGNNWEYKFTENPLMPGEYISNQEFNVAGGINYQLIVQYNDIVDTALAQLVAITPLKQIQISPFEEYYKVNYTESSEPSLLEVVYNWSQIPEFCETYGACMATENYYTLKNIDVSKIFAPQKQVISFPKGTQIIRRKYSLSPAHQDYLRSLLLETDWRGGIFDTEPGNARSNFKHGTLGWFATSMVLTDTTIVE